MANTSDTKTGIGLHIAAAGIVVATVLLLAVLRMAGVAPGWLIGAVVVFNVVVVLAVLMHVVGEGGPVRHLAAFTLFLLVALSVLTWYSENNGYEGATLEGFITGGFGQSEVPASGQGEE